MKNKAIIFYLFFFIGGYLLFLTSGIWMPGSGSGTRQTPLHVPNKWEGRQVTIERWEYAEADQKMEIELSVVNQVFDQIDKYNYSARTKGGKNLTVKPIIEDPDMIILQIEGVKPDFNVIRLQMEMPEDENQTMTGDALKLFTGSEVVSKAETLPVLTKEEYTINHMDQVIVGYEEEISRIEDEIKEELDKIEPIEKEIKRLTDRLAYETEEEAAETKEVIRQAEQKIEVTKNAAEDKRQDIKTLEEKIRLQKEKIEAYKSAGATDKGGNDK